MTTTTAAPSLLQRIPWWVYALVSGVVLGLSQPILIESITGRELLDPSGLTGLLALVGMVPALLAIDGVVGVGGRVGVAGGPGRAYAIGFVTWVTCFSVVVHWLVTTVHVYGGLPLAVGIAALFGVTVTIGSIVASSFAITRVLVRRYGWPSWITLPATLAGVELLRDIGPHGGFPWGSLGHSFATVPVLLQSAALVGITGLTFLAGLSNAIIADVIAARLRGRPWPLRAIITGVVVCGGVLGYGAARLSTTEQGDTLRIAMIQPNVNEGLADLSREEPEATARRMQQQQKQAVEQGAELVVWPEGALRNPIAASRKTMRGTKMLGPDDPVPPAAVVGSVAGVPGNRHIRYNSAFVVDKDLNVAGVFHKTHLVPFGEYVPWPFGGLVRSFIPIGGLTPGTEFQPIPVVVNGRRISIGPTVCYEGIFPEISRELVDNGADLLVNLTDDRWYGMSGMATQHLLMYALRAVETGRPVVRAANTGISAWIDTRGRIHDRTRMYEEAVVVTDMTLAHEDTLYARAGDWLAILCAVVTLGAWVGSMFGPHVWKRTRPTIAWVVAAQGLASVVGGLLFYASNSGTHEESVATKALWLVLYGLLTGVGALSDRPWGRRAIGVLAIVCSLGGLTGLAIGKSIAGAPVMLAGAFCFVAGRRLRSAPMRDADPVRAAA